MKCIFEVETAEEASAASRALAAFAAALRGDDACVSLIEPGVLKPWPLDSGQQRAEPEDQETLDALSGERLEPEPGAHAFSNDEPDPRVVDAVVQAVPPAPAPGVTLPDGTFVGANSMPKRRGRPPKVRPLDVAPADKAVADADPAPVAVEESADAGAEGVEDVVVIGLDDTYVSAYVEPPENAPGIFEERHEPESVEAPEPVKVQPEPARDEDAVKAENFVSTLSTNYVIAGAVPLPEAKPEPSLDADFMAFLEQAPPEPVVDYGGWSGPELHAELMKRLRSPGTGGIAWYKGELTKRGVQALGDMSADDVRSMLAEDDKRRKG